MRSLAVFVSLTIGCLYWSAGAAADDPFLLAYFIEMEMEGEVTVLQERGIRLRIDSPHVIPMGRAGRGKCVFRLISVENDSGQMMVEIYADDRSEFAAISPTYSLDVDFDVGSLGEIRSTQAGIGIELAFTIVRP